MGFFESMLAKEQFKDDNLREIFTERYEARDGILPTLSDEESAALFFLPIKATEPGKIVGLLSEKCREHFKALQGMRTVRGPFFERFAILAKPTDGILVGFGKDEVYYVLATWDQNGQDLWQPQQDLCKRPVIS